MSLRRHRAAGRAVPLPMRARWLALVLAATTLGCTSTGSLTASGPGGPSGASPEGSTVGSLGLCAQSPELGAAQHDRRLRLVARLRQVLHDRSAANVGLLALVVAVWIALSIALQAALSRRRKRNVG